jgi:competence protein ComEC
MTTDRRAQGIRALALGLGLLAALAFAVLLSRPDGHLRLVFPATPGDAVLIQTPDGRFVLVDGGGDGARLALLLGQRLPFYRRSLDTLILTAPDEQRAAGQVAALARYEARLVLGPPGAPRGATQTRLRELLAEQGQQLLVARVGQRLRLGALTLQVLDAPNPQNPGRGILLRLEYGTTSILLAGALQPEQHERLRALAPVTAAQLPWQQDIDPRLIAQLDPRALIFADGYRAKHPPLRSYFERAGSTRALYHEQNNGTVELISNGRTLWIETER